MGLDLALGGLVLLAAFRGYLKGFLIQAIRIGGLVAAVYVADPVRGQVKPYVVDYLPTIRPELFDRMLWWASGFVSYFVLVGVASMAVAVARRPTYGIAEPQRGDQFAGFGLGLLKGLITVSFMLAAVQKYLPPAQLARFAWADEQVKTSQAWDWNTRYEPAARIWAAPPVQQFVNHIHKMGLLAPAPKTDEVTDTEAVKSAVQTASRTPSLVLPSHSSYKVPEQPRRPKLVLRQPVNVPESRRSAPRHDVDSEASPSLESLESSLSGMQGVDPEMIKALNSLQGQLKALSGPEGG